MRKLFSFPRTWFIAVLLAIAAWLSVGVLAVDNGVSGNAPTTNTDSSSITNLTSIRIYRVIVTGENPVCPTAAESYTVLSTVPFSTPGARFNYVDASVSSSGRYCYRATAVLATGAESALSVVAFKDVDLRIPNPPTGITVS